MKLAYLILAHTNPRLLARTVNTLACEDDAFFIHIDQKADMSRFMDVRGRGVYFLEKRIPVYWGEFSVVRAALRLLAEALCSPTHYDYFLLLSGSDYPLRSGPYVHSFFSRMQGWECMSIIEMPNEAAGQPLAKLNRVRVEAAKPVLRIATKVLGKAGLMRRDYRRHLRGLKPYAGDMWWAMSRNAATYALDWIEENPFLERYFYRTPAPDEMFLHTVLGNSPFREQMRRNLHYTDWSASGNHPAMIDEQHLKFFDSAERVLIDDVWGAGEVLFARKFSDDRLDMVDKIDTMMRRKESALA